MTKGVKLDGGFEFIYTVVKFDPWNAFVSIVLTELGIGYWIGNTTGDSVGIVKSIASNTSLTLVANASVAITATTARYSPYGVPYTVANANSEVIPANSTNNSITVGQGNIV